MWQILNTKITSSAHVARTFRLQVSYERSSVLCCFHWSLQLILNNNTCCYQRSFHSSLCIGEGSVLSWLRLTNCFIYWIRELLFVAWYFYFSRIHNELSRLVLVDCESLSFGMDLFIMWEEGVLCCAVLCLC